MLGAWIHTGLDRAPVVPGRLPPIGRPIPNARVYVLGPGLHLMPPGVTGELYLAGAGIARGYLGQPALTAARFLPDPFGEPGSRMYHTGDLGRWREDGQIEFLGRVDHQVKINGFRVEPGEAEAQLLERADVRRAVVVVREDVPGVRRLVAYLVAAPGARKSAREVLVRLRERLPSYLVPDAVVWLDTIPTNAHDKVDRAALGLRISECLALRWSDVDWLNARLRVERGIVCQRVDNVKTTESRKQMSMDTELLALLKAWKQISQFSGMDDWMFASPVQLGRLPWSYPWVWRMFQNAAADAGVGKLSTHTMRHSYRAWLDAVGTGVVVQQKLMRHADIRTTMNVYGDVVTDEMQQANSKVAGLALNGR